MPSKYDAEQSNKVMALYNEVANYKMIVDFIMGWTSVREKSMSLDGLRGDTSQSMILTILQSLEKKGLNAYLMHAMGRIQKRVTPHGNRMKSNFRKK
mmetsp:Transcript_7238/g.13746  ORF Transcript_7238/g.13746 Transcript_7238/m.13746 type:complete len:97 (-) Transcript_7238:2469-2759(-)